MKVGDLLREAPFAATQHEPASSAWERMHERHVDYLAVVDDAGHVVGVLARQDLGGPSGGSHRRMGRTVGDLMQREFVAVTPQTSVRRAAALMRRHATGCLPVLKSGSLVGLLTVSSLLEVLEHATL